MLDRTRQIDEASGYGPTPKPKQDPSDGTNDLINRRKTEKL